MGSHTDEPIFWSDLLAKGGHTEVSVLIEQSLVGDAYLKSFRDACRRKGIRIVAEASIAETAGDLSDAVRAYTTRRRRRSCTAASASGSCSSRRSNASR